MAGPTDLTPVAGPLLLGYMLNLGLFGILTVQVYVYFLAFKNDDRYTKALVYLLFVLEAAQTVVASNDAYFIFAKNFGNTGDIYLDRSVWLSIPIFTSIISALVQSYYAYRVYVISRSKIFAIVISVMSLFQFSTGIATGINAHRITTYVELQVEAVLVPSIWSISTAVCDILITVCMAFYLLKRDTGMDTTHEVITRLVCLIVGTGSLTAAVAIIDVILFLTFPNKLYYICSAYALPKLYSNSVLVLFNSRARIVDGDQSIMPEHGLHHTRYRKGGPHRNATVSIVATTVIHVQEETWKEAARDLPATVVKTS